MEELLENGITGKAKIIGNITNNLGCMSYKQAQFICGTNQSTDSALNFLKRNRICKKNSAGDLILPIEQGKYESETIDCIWAMLRKSIYMGIDEKKHMDTEAIQYAYRPTRDIRISMNRDGKLYLFIFLTEKEAATILSDLKLMYPEEKEHVADGIQFCFLFREPIVMDIIKEVGFPHAHRLMFLKGEATEVPTFTVLKAK